MRLVNREEYSQIMSIFKDKMLKLANHESKNSYFGQVAIDLCYTRNLNEELQVFQIFTPYFLTVIRYDYLKALEDTPECFGTHNAKDVIHALYLQAKERNYPWNEERYTEFLSNECFCLLICKNDQEFIEDVLRIDLFRELNGAKDFSGCFDFTGGIFHALKHFSVGKQCASISPNQNVSLYDVEQLIWPTAKAFFEGGIKKKNSTNYDAEIIYLDKLIKLGLYKEENSQVYFIKTLYAQSI